MYYDSEYILSNGNFKNSYFHGEITNYFENGNVSMTSNYENGLQAEEF